MHAKRCRELGGTEGKCWFYGPGACAGCHTSIHISDALALKRAARAAPSRRNLLAMPFTTHLTILHHTYQFAPSKSGRPSPWSSVLYFDSPPEARRTKVPLTLLTNSKTSHLSSVSMSLSSPSTWLIMLASSASAEWDAAQ